MDDNVRLGKEIRRIREARGKSLTNMAEACGVTPPHISEIENGRKPVSDKLLHKISEYLGLDEKYIFEYAGRTPYTTLKALRQRKSIADLVSVISKELDDDEIDRVVNIIFKIKKQRGLITDEEVDALVEALKNMEIAVCTNCDKPKDRCT